MCGIVGIQKSQQVSSLVPELESSLTCMCSRGPDGSGTVISKNGDRGIGMCRLRTRSRIDDSVPFVDPTGHKYAFNGQIFSDEASSGVEEIDGGWKEAQTAFAKESCPNGMWASAVLSETEGIKLSRDPWGIKPLWVRHFEKNGESSENEWMAASTLTALTNTGQRPTLRNQAIFQFLLVGRVYDGGSFWEGIRSFPPGAIGNIDQESVSPERRFAPAVDRMRAKLSQARDEATISTLIRNSINQSVAHSLKSERNIGLAISGGLDSTIIAWHNREMGIENLQTISIKVAGDKDGITSMSQLPWEGDKPKTWTHHSRIIRSCDYIPLLRESIRELGHPTSLTSAPLYLALAKLANEANITVLMVGEGADEIWGGYRSYLNLTDSSLPIEFYLPEDHFSIAQSLLGHDAANKARETLVNHLPLNRGAKTILKSERLHSLQPLLDRTDQLMMSQSVEARTPFLYGDSWVIADETKWDELISNGRTKFRLRSAYKEQLPQFLNIEKRPFRAPWNRWLSTEFGNEVRSIILSAKHELGDLDVSLADAREIIEGGIAGHPAAADFTFRLLTLAIWLTEQDV